VDVLINRQNSRIKGMFDMGALYSDLADTLGKNVDLVTTDALEQPMNRLRNPWFAGELYKERVILYEKQ
jgi:predicted nucleotidyltransferase